MATASTHRSAAHDSTSPTDSEDVEIEDPTSCPVASGSSNKGLKVLGRAVLQDGSTVYRRLPVNLEKSTLADWVEMAGIIFYRFLPTKHTAISLFDSGGAALDSDEKLLSTFQSHQTCSSSLDFLLNVVFASTMSPPCPVVNNVGQLTEKTVDCTECGETVTAGLDSKCFHCNNVRLCNVCEAAGKHDGHLLLPYIVLLLGFGHNGLDEASRLDDGANVPSDLVSVKCSL